MSRMTPMWGSIVSLRECWIVGIFKYLKRFFSKPQVQPQIQASVFRRGWVNPQCRVSQASDLGCEWTMPCYRGRDICDWVPEISRAKREGEWDRALSLSVGCMNAMIDEAARNPVNVMEYYVIQVAIIQHKMKAYRDEILTVQGWLSLDYPAPRADYRINLRKRLAKAQELVAKSEGADSSAYHEEWKALVEMDKVYKAAKKFDSRISTGSSKVRSEVGDCLNSLSCQPVSGRSRKSVLIPSTKDLKTRTFVAVDFETANRNAASACQIAMVLVNGGKVIDRYSTYLKPPSDCGHFEYTNLHGIGKKEVLSAPTWLDVAAAVSQFVGDSPVWAHNSSFDSRVWRALDEYYGTCTLPARFYCSYRTSKEIIPGLENYKLPTVLRECDPGFYLDHHRADSDAEACARIVCALQRLA